MSLITNFGSIASSGGGFVLPGWAYTMVITIPANSIDADLQNLPLPVYLNNLNFDFSKAKAGGEDIRFGITSDGGATWTMLKFERKEHSNVLQKAVYNVLVPFISDIANTKIYMFYGNPNAYNDSIEAWQDKTGKQLTYNGNVKLVPNVAKWGKCAKFDGNGHSIVANATTEFNVAVNQDFVIEDWFRIDALPTASTGSYYTIFDNGNGNTNGINIQMNTTVAVAYVNSGSSRGTFPVSKIRLGEMNFLEVGRTSGTFYISLNGEQLLSFVLADAITMTASGGYGFKVGGCNSSATYGFIGYHDDFRYRVGIGGHTTAFTPPTEPFTADQYTKLLLHFDDFDAMRIATSTTGVDYLSYNKTGLINSTKTTVVEAKLKVETSGSALGQTLGIYNGTKYAGMDCRTNAVICNFGGTSPYTHNHDGTIDHIYTIEFQGTTQAVFKVDNIVVHTATYANLQVGAINAIYFGEGNNGANCGGSALWKYLKYNLDLVGTPATWVEWNLTMGLPTANGWTANGTASLATLVFKDETDKATYTYGDVKPIKTAYADGARSAYFDGSGDYFSTPDSEDWNFGSGSFCDEVSVILDALPASGTFVCFLSQSIPTVQTGYFIIRNTGGTYTLEYTAGSLSFVRTITPSIGTKYDFSVAREGNTARMFQNGIQLGADYSTSATLPNYTSLFVIGGYIDTAVTLFVNGKILGVRRTKGRSRYTGAYTPPTKFDIDGSDVVFCTNFDTIYDQNYAMVQHMGDTLVDATGNGNNGTATGTTVVNTEFGKARSFNGTSDKITIAHSTSQNLFPLSATVMFKPTAEKAMELLGKYVSSSSNGYMLRYNSGLGLYYFKDVSNYVDAYDPYYGGSLLNQTAVMGAKVDNTNGKIFRDGSIIQTNNWVGTAGAPTSADALTISDYSTWFLQGNVHEVRLGSARSDAWIKAESLALKNQLLTMSVA